MTDKEIIRAAMKLRKVNQTELAEMSGVGTQSSVTGFLNRNKYGIRSDIVTKMLNGLGFDVIAVDRNDSERRFLFTPEPEGKSKKEKTEEEMKLEEHEERETDKKSLDIDAILDL